MNHTAMWMEPVMKETVWGGSKLRSVMGKTIPSDHTGESWEIAAHRNGQSRIVTGPLAGKTMQEAIEIAPQEILGTYIWQKYGTHFPLLIKLIDANDNLSVQVHPSDAMAAKLEGAGESGKTEMWVVLEAKPDAKLLYGFKKEVTPQAFAKAIEEQKLEDLVNWVPVQKRDAFFIPAGTLHAIGAGILLAEIQQNSDTTYRVYDFGRLGLDGKPRELHVEKALQVTDLHSSQGREYANLETGILCPYFKTWRHTLQGEYRLQLEADRFEILMVLEGSGSLSGRPFKAGDSILLPAALEEVFLEGNAQYLQVIPE